MNVSGYLRVFIDKSLLYHTSLKLLGIPFIKCRFNYQQKLCFQLPGSAIIIKLTYVITHACPNFGVRGQIPERHALGVTPYTY